MAKSLRLCFLLKAEHLPSRDDGVTVYNRRARLRARRIDVICLQSRVRRARSIFFKGHREFDNRPRRYWFYFLVPLQVSLIK